MGLKSIFKKPVTILPISEGNTSTPTILVSDERIDQAHLKNVVAPLNYGLEDPPEVSEGRRGRLVLLSLKLYNMGVYGLPGPK